MDATTRSSPEAARERPHCSSVTVFSQMNHRASRRPMWR